MKKAITFILKAIATVITAGIVLIWINLFSLNEVNGQEDVGVILAFYAYMVIVALEIPATIGIWRNPKVGGIGFVLLGLVWSGSWFVTRSWLSWGEGFLIIFALPNFICGALSLVVRQIEKKITPVGNT